MDEIRKNIETIRQKMAEAAHSAGRAPEDILLVAATKTRTADEIRTAIEAGVDACGENRVQELTEKKAQQAYTGAPLHFIGHLQRNKVNKVVGEADIIESVASLELLRDIERRAGALGIVQDVFFEINIAEEQSKSGMLPGDLPLMLEAVGKTGFVRLRGLMAIPPISEKMGANRHYFAIMRNLYIDIKTKKYDNVSMDFLSMGMSDDYADAILEGANMVRVGSAIFGARRAWPPVPETEQK